MPLIVKIFKGDDKEPIAGGLVTVECARLKDGTYKRLSHPGEPFQLWALEQEGLLAEYKLIATHLSYYVKEDRFDYCEECELSEDVIRVGDSKLSKYGFMVVPCGMC